MRIALATCANLPDWEVDDRPLFAAFEARGIEIAHPAWDDPGFDWAACDACLIRTTWDYMERREEYLRWAERVAALTRLFNPPEIVRWNTHKRYLDDLAAKGIPVVPTVRLPARTAVELDGLLAERGWSRAFLKPAIGATARETLRFAADRSGLEAARKHLNRMLAKEDMLLQPYLPSVEIEGELSLILIDGEFSHAVRKRPVPGDYRVQDDHGASDEPAEVCEAEIALAKNILGAVDGNLLYARTDFLRDENGGLCLSELELTEPSLFFRHGPEAADRLAEALCKRLADGG